MPSHDYIPGRLVNCEIDSLAYNILLQLRQRSVKAEVNHETEIKYIGAQYVLMHSHDYTYIRQADYKYQL